MDRPLTRTNTGDMHSRSYPTNIRKILGELCRRPFKRQIQHLDKEMTNLSTTLMKSSETTETLASVANGAHQQDLCLFSESPHYVVRVRMIFRTRTSESMNECRSPELAMSTNSSV